MLNELKKHRYLNLIDITAPLKLDQFMKFEGTMDKDNEIKMLSSNVSQGILVTKEKLEDQDRLANDILLENNSLEKDKKNFSNIKIAKDKQIQEILREVKKKETEFINEQILKFGTTIKFEYLLKAAKDTTVINLTNLKLLYINSLYINLTIFIG